MKYAFIDNIKTEAKPSLKGKCINCGNDVRSYCGEQMVHHWKHIHLDECDSWYERETEWHRNWKNKFDISCQEVIKFDPINEEKHIADIYLQKKDLVIEFQHSPIEIEEIKSRELYYDKMIWIIDLSSNQKNIEFNKSKEDIRLLFSKMRNNLPKEFEVDKEFADKNEKDNEVSDFLGFLGLDRNKTIESQYISSLEDKYLSLSQKKHHSIMTWKNMHKRWDYSVKPKFLDFGDNYLYQIIERIKLGSAYIVKQYSKSFFLEYYK